MTKKVCFKIIALGTIITIACTNQQLSGMGLPAACKTIGYTALSATGASTLAAYFICANRVATEAVGVTNIFTAPLTLFQNTTDQVAGEILLFGVPITAVATFAVGAFGAWKTIRAWRHRQRGAALLIVLPSQEEE